MIADDADVEPAPAAESAPQRLTLEARCGECEVSGRLAIQAFGA